MVHMIWSVGLTLLLFVLCIFCVEQRMFKYVAGRGYMLEQGQNETQLLLMQHNKFDTYDHKQHSKLALLYTMGRRYNGQDEVQGGERLEKTHKKHKSYHVIPLGGHKHIIHSQQFYWAYETGTA